MAGNEMTVKAFVEKHGPHPESIGFSTLAFQEDLLRLLAQAKAEGIRMAADIGVRTIIDGSDIEQSKFNLNERLWALSNQIEKEPLHANH